MTGHRDTRRRFEQWARNPECQANVISAVAGIEMAKVAEAEGLTPTMGQSPFAIARGQVFERELLKDDAARLIEALIEGEVLTDGASGLIDLRTRINSGPLPNMDVAHEETLAVLAHMAESGVEGLKQSVPAVVASATLKITGQPVMLPDGILAIDALIVRADEAGERIELLVAEVKSYPYRAGSTDTTELSTSRAQAGLYRYALNLAVDELGLEDRISVAASGLLILTRHGSNRPQVLATEDLTHQSERAKAGFKRLRDAAKTLEEFNVGDEPEAITRVEDADVSYRADCISFCDRADYCREKAERCGDGNVLGTDVARFLAGVDLNRAIALIDGAEPENDVERDLLSRIHEAKASEVAP